MLFANISTLSTLAHYVGIFYCSNALELIVIQTRKQISETILNFSQNFCLILSQNRQFDFVFKKSMNKNGKCGNLWHKK